MNCLSRSIALKLAAALSLLLGVYTLILMSPYLMRGAADVNQASDGPPYTVILLACALSFVRFVTAYGTWRNQRWGVVLTLLANALDTLAAVPGIFFAPTIYIWIGAIIDTVLGIVIIVLCLWRDHKAVLV